MHTLTLCGLKAEMLAAQTNGQGFLGALEETSAAALVDALPRLLPEELRYSVLTHDDGPLTMSTMVDHLRNIKGGAILLFWNVHLYNPEQINAVAAAITGHTDGSLILLHTQDAFGASIEDLLTMHGAVRSRCDIEPTPVLFRVEKKGDFKGHLTAVFPTIPGTNDPYTFTVYAHVGQHSSGSHGWYVETRAAKEDEYAELAQELERIGYLLDVRQRWVQKFDTTRRAALQSMAA